MGNSQSSELQLAVMANILIRRPIPHTDHTFYSNLLTLPTNPDDIYQNFTLETLRNILTHQKPNYATLLKVTVMELHAIVWRGKQTVRVQSAASLHSATQQAAIGGGSEWVGERKERLLNCLRLLTRLLAIVNESPERDIRQFMCGSVLAGMLEAEEEKRRQRLAAEARRERERKNAAEMEKRALAMAMEREKERAKEEQIRVEREARAATAAAEAAQAAALHAKQAKQVAVDVNGSGVSSPTHGSPFGGGSTSSPKRVDGKVAEEEFASEDEGRDVPVGNGVQRPDEAELAVARVVDDAGQVSEVEIVVRRDGPDGSGAQAGEAVAAPSGDSTNASTADAGSAPVASDGDAVSDFDFISAVASKTNAAASEQTKVNSSTAMSEEKTSTDATSPAEQPAVTAIDSTQMAAGAVPLAAATDTNTAPPSQPSSEQPAGNVDTASASENTASTVVAEPVTASSAHALESTGSAASSFASASTPSSVVPASTAASSSSATDAAVPAPLPPLSLDSWWVGELYGQPLHSLLASLLIDLCFLPSFTSPLTSTPSVARHELILGKCWAVGCGFPAKLADEAYSTGGNRAAEEWDLDGNRVEVLRCLLACVSAPMFRSVVRHDDVIVGNVVGERRELSVTLAYSMLNVLLGWRVETTVPYAQAIWTDYRKPLVEMCTHLLMVLLDHQVTHTDESSEEAEDGTEDEQDAVRARSVSAVSQSHLNRSDSVASTTSSAFTPPSIRVPEDSSVSTGALTTSRHSNPSTQQQIEQQQTLRYSPHHNLFSDHLYSLSPPDCTYFYNSICRLLHHGMMAYATWLPSSSNGLSLEAELLVLMWKMLDNHPHFLSHVLNECDALSLLTPLLFYCFDARKDTSRLGLLYTGVFTLLKLSGEREFAVQLNNTVPSAPLAHLPIFHLLGMPELQGGTYADALVLVAHKLIVSSPNHLDALLKVLLTLLANISPYITRLSAISALRLVSLFELFCQPAYIYGKEHNHVYAALLLDLFNNLIQYQWQGSGPLVLAIVRRAEVFYSLRVVHEGGEHYIQPMTGVGAKGHAMVFRERHRVAGLSSPSQAAARRSTSAAASNHAGSMAGVAPAAIDQHSQAHSGAAASVVPPSTSPRSSVESVTEDGTTDRPLSASQPLPNIAPTHNDSPTSATATLPASRTLSQSVSTPTHRSMAGTPEPSASAGPAPTAATHTPTTAQLAIPPFHLEQYASAAFHPSHAWANSWKARLPLETIYRLYDHILPKVVSMASQQPLTDERLLQFIQSQTLVGILPLPHAIVVRRYIRNEWTNSWFSVYLWGLVFLKQQQPKLFDGKKVRLFAISSKGGGGGGTAEPELEQSQTAEAVAADEDGI